MKKPIAYLILSTASVVLAYGKPIEIKGAAAIVLWLVPIVFMIFQAIKNSGVFRAAFIAVLACYFISRGLYFLRNHGGVKVVRTERIEGSVVEYCDIDPGAMGSVRVFRGSYRDMGG